MNSTDPDLLPNISVGPHAFALLQLYYGQSHASVTCIFMKFTRLFIYLCIYFWSHKALAKRASFKDDQLTSRAHKIISQIREHLEIEDCAHGGIHPFIKQYIKISSEQKIMHHKLSTKWTFVKLLHMSHADLNQSTSSTV